MSTHYKIKPAVLQRAAIQPPRAARLGFKILIFALAILAVSWSLRDVSFTGVAENFRRLGWQAVLVLVSLNALIFILFSSRWWLILRTMGVRAPLISILAYRLSGFGVTYFTPGPQFGGEPLQVFLLQKRQGVPFETGAASVALDKLLELAANFSFLAVGVAVLLMSGLLEIPRLEQLIFLPVLLLSLPLLYLVLLRNGQLPVSSIMRFTNDRLWRSNRLHAWTATAERVESQTSQFCQVNMPSLIGATVLSAGIWALMVFEFGLTLRFLGLNLNLVQVLVALTAARISFLLPIPAGLGTLEAGQVFAMGLIGVNPLFGISMSLLIRVRDILFGAIGLILGSLFNR